MLLYRSKKPLHRTVGVKRLLLVCPREEIGNCESTGTAALSEDSNRPSADPGSRRKNAVGRFSSRTPGSGSKNVESFDCKISPSGENMSDFVIESLRTPGSGRKNVESLDYMITPSGENMDDAVIESLRTPGCGRENVVRVQVILQAERIVDLR